MRYVGTADEACSMLQELGQPLNVAIASYKFDHEASPAVSMHVTELRQVHLDAALLTAGCRTDLRLSCCRSRATQMQQQHRPSPRRPASLQELLPPQPRHTPLQGAAQAVLRHT